MKKRQKDDESESTWVFKLTTIFYGTQMCEKPLCISFCLCFSAAEVHITMTTHVLVIV